MELRDVTARQTRAAAEHRAAAHRDQVAAGRDAGSRLTAAILGLARRVDDRHSRRRRSVQLSGTATQPGH